MASPQGSVLSDRAIVDAIEQLRRLLDSKQSLDPEHRAYVVAYTYPSGMKPHEVTGKNFETELTEDAVRQLVPKLVGKKFATSHGRPSTVKSTSFDEEPIAIGKIKAAQLDEKGCVVTLIELDTTPDALFTGQLIYDGLKPDVSLFYWIAPDKENPRQLAIDLDHVSAETKGFHKGTQIIGYFQHAKELGKQKFRIFEPTLERMGTVALSMIFEAIKESRCTDAIAPYVQAWQRNAVPDSMELAAEQPVAEPAPLALSAEGAPEAKPSEEAASASGAGNPEPATDVLVMPASTEPASEQPKVDLGAVLAALQEELAQLRKSLQPKEAEAAVGLPAAEAAPTEPVASEAAAEAQPADAMVLEAPASKSQTLEVAAPVLPVPVTPKTKSPPTEPLATTRQAPQHATPAPSPATSFASLGLAQPVGNSANFLRRPMSSGNPMSSMDTSAPVMEAPPAEQAPAAPQHDLVADAPLPQPYTSQEILERAAKGEPLDQARMLASYIQLETEHHSTKQRAEEIERAENEKRVQALASLKSFLTTYQPEMSKEIEEVIQQGPDSPAVRLASAMAASAQDSAKRPESDEKTASQRLALDALAQRQVHPPAANNRYVPYTLGNPKAMQNSAFARGAVSQTPSFSLHQQAAPAQAPAAGTPTLTQQQLEAGLNLSAFSRQRGVLRT